MKLTTHSRRILAARRDARRMEAAGYTSVIIGHRLPFGSEVGRSDEIVDVRLGVNGGRIWVKYQAGLRPIEKEAAE